MSAQEIERTVNTAHMQVSDKVAIEIRDMNKWYGQFHVLRDVNLTVYEGERILIRGPSGSGKSTLIRCINRLEEHQAGSIGHGTGVLRPQERRQGPLEVGMVFPALQPVPAPDHPRKLHAGADLGAQDPRQGGGATAMHFWKRSRSPNRRTNTASFPAASSSGWPRPPLCMRPWIMLFDEPTSALDPEMIKEVLDTRSARKA